MCQRDSAGTFPRSREETRDEPVDTYQQLVYGLGVSDVVGRHGERLSAGDDELFSWAASGAGQGFGVFPELRVTHLILARRLGHGYFLRLTHDHAFSHSVLRYLLTGAKPRRVDLSESEPNPVRPCAIAPSW